MSAESSSPASLTLFRGWPERTAYSWSPFVTKLEFHLRISGVSYNSEAGSPLKAPKGKIPYVDITPQGTTPSLLGDSGLIIKHLMERGQIKDLNSTLSPEQKLHDIAVRALLEEKLYFYNVSEYVSSRLISGMDNNPRLPQNDSLSLNLAHADLSQMRERWLENYYVQRDKALWATPYLMRILVGLMIHRNNTAMLYGQGTGRLSSEEVTMFRREIWESINCALASIAKNTDAKDMPFWILGGTAPTEADATLFGFITSVLVSTR